MNHPVYEAVIGLEVHAQLSTKSKLFCGDSIAFGGQPNVNTSPVSLAHPGTLPVMNEQVLKLAAMLGLALGCEIVRENYFARKNYFYPDLPKAYQISQHTAPICLGGKFTITNAEGKTTDVLLNRIHMEEDAGKSIHDIYDAYSCIDLNRAGTPLLEIVTEPCIHSAEDAANYLTELRRLVRWLGVCDGNMEEGSLRCDANISIRKKGDTKLGTRVEIKNLNSIRNLRRAIETELQRLVAITEKGEKVFQETRGYTADTNTTYSLRSKEDAEDYRYFPEPDLPPFSITDAFIDGVKSEMPELPIALQHRYEQEYGLSAYDVSQVTLDREDVDFFEEIRKHFNQPKVIANWMSGPLRSYANENHIALKEIPLQPKQLASLMEFSHNGKVSFNVAGSRLFQKMLESPEADVATVAEKEGVLQLNDENELARWIDEVIAAMPDKVAEYKNGKKGLIGMFAGEVKKRSKGRADMAAVNKLLAQKLA